MKIIFYYLIIIKYEKIIFFVLKKICNFINQSKSMEKYLNFNFMKKYFLNFLVIFFIIFFVSCSQNKHNKFEGEWELKYIAPNDSNVMFSVLGFVIKETVYEFRSNDTLLIKSKNKENYQIGTYSQINDSLLEVDIDNEKDTFLYFFENNTLKLYNETGTVILKRQ